MRPTDDRGYFTLRAYEEARKAREAMNRGAHPASVAVHGELSARYHEKAVVRQQMDSSTRG